VRNAILISAGLHVTAIVLTVVGLPSLFDSDSEPVVPIVVEVVTMAEVEKPQPQAKPKAKPKPPPQREPPEPPPAPEPPPEPIAEAPPPEPAPPEPKQVVEKIPAPKPPEPAPKPVVEDEPPAKPTPRPRPKPKLALLTRQKPPPQPQPPRLKPPPPPDAFDKLLKDLEKDKKRESEKRKQPEQKRAPEPPIHVAQPVAPPPRQPTALEKRMVAASLSQEVMRQVSPCWSIPVGVKDAHEIRVGIRVYLKPDGTLSGPPRVEDQNRMNSDYAFRTVAESALRALRNPRCSPLRLPMKNYDTWREISFNFDPRELIQ
jgi:hypothetical protein